MKTIKYNILPFLGLSFLSCIALTACNNRGKKESTDHVQTILQSDSNQVQTMVMTFRNFDHELLSNGTVTAHQKADLVFDSPEIVEDIYVRNGQHVVKRQKIATLIQFKLKNTVRQALDNLEKAKLELQDVLISQGYVLRDSLHIPPETLKIAKIKSNYENCVIQYELAVFNLNKSVLYAPFDGTVANLFSKKHNMPPSSLPFCTIIGSAAPEVDFMALESEIGLIHIGDQVQISPFAISDYSVSGKISEINPVVDNQGMVRIKAQINQKSNKLFDGMNVKVRVKRAIGHQLIIPKSALVLRNNKKVVFTAKQGKAIWNYVETGAENTAAYIITSGLKAGDTVIYTGNLNLAHETPVQLQAPDNKAIELSKN